MTNLLENLTFATKELKAAYLVETEKFAGFTFNEALINSKKTSEELEENFVFETDERLVVEKASNLRIESMSIVRNGLNALVVKEIKAAVKHFENSLIKLETRIVKKRLELEGLNFEYGYVEANFNCLITDKNGKQVKAQTILAEGSINKPHYRYLVK